MSNIQINDIKFLMESSCSQNISMTYAFNIIINNIVYFMLCSVNSNLSTESDLSWNIYEPKYYVVSNFIKDSLSYTFYILHDDDIDISDKDLINALEMNTFSIELKNELYKSLDIVTDHITNNYEDDIEKVFS